MATSDHDLDADDPCCKVAAAADRRGLATLDEELRQLRKDQDASLRELAKYVDEQLLESALREAGVEIAADPGTVRSVVIGTPAEEMSVDVAVRERIATALDRSDVDVGSLEREFVSHETVRRHLNDHLGVDTARSRADPSVEETREMIASIIERDRSVVEQSLGSLRRADRLDSGPLEASLTVRVTCPDCEETYAVDELLDEASCACASQ
ncbi:rod-determining factor RdfA [Salinarchaeum laminariae]|uniref:rod-determining factor RdfA n=1 Tax=Salinarchaeum laminariae TaxID=869888 RepID=UPI0020C1266E|nr:rod-determining factor RdfA [Salinarchaeum laminariae]